MRLPQILKYFFFCCLILFPLLGKSQITPPGMGPTKTASWFAIGLSQDLSYNNDWQSKTYIGVGRESGQGSRNPFLNKGFFIINQEFKNDIVKNWEYALGLSYRRRSKYEKAPPYLATDPAIEQEFRLYGKIEYAYTFNRLKIAPSIKQELRKYYTPAFENAKKMIEFRTRFRIKLSVQLDKEKRHSIIAISEQLFPINQSSITKEWSKFRYKESRFSLFYSYSPKQLPMAFEIGYTNQLVGIKDTHSAHYFTFDIMFKNLFEINKDKLSVTK